MATDIIVVDDDPIVGTLTLELLREAGISARLISDSLRAQEEIQNEQPAMVILDILMPGIDGLTLLHRLKADPRTAKIRAVIVSGKSFTAEKTRAYQYGAESFIEKPYNVENFARKISDLLKSGNSEANKTVRAPLSPLAEAKRDITIKVWGCRSAALNAPSIGATRYGRNTPCVSVEVGAHMLIFDAGSGITRLGDEIIKNGRHKNLWLFLSHFHHGHIEGLSRFACADDPTYILNIAGSGEPHKPLDASLAEAFAPKYPSGAPPCKVELYEMIEQTYEIMPDVRLTAFFANHPGTTLGFVLQTQDRKIVYCPDSEVYGEAATALQDYDEKLGGLIRDADVLIHDGRYTDADYKTHRNTGHSSRG
jgi:CheY-like chemotaxis protein